MIRMLPDGHQKRIIHSPETHGCVSNEQRCPAPGDQAVGRLRGCCVQLMPMPGGFASTPGVDRVDARFRIALVAGHRPRLREAHEPLMPVQLPDDLAVADDVRIERIETAPVHERRSLRPDGSRCQSMGSPNDRSRYPSRSKRRSMRASAAVTISRRASGNRRIERRGRARVGHAGEEAVRQTFSEELERGLGCANSGARVLSHVSGSTRGAARWTDDRATSTASCRLRYAISAAASCGVCSRRASRVSRRRTPRECAPVSDQRGCQWVGWGVHGSRLARKNT